MDVPLNVFATARKEYGPMVKNSQSYAPEVGMVWLVSNSPVLGFHLYITLSILWLFPGGGRWTDVHHEGKQFLVCVGNKTQKQAQLHEYLSAGHKAVCK